MSFIIEYDDEIQIFEFHILPSNVILYTLEYNPAFNCLSPSPYTINDSEVICNQKIIVPDKDYMYEFNNITSYIMKKYDTTIDFIITSIINNRNKYNKGGYKCKEISKFSIDINLNKEQIDKMISKMIELNNEFINKHPLFISKEHGGVLMFKDTKYVIPIHIYSEFLDPYNMTSNLNYLIRYGFYRSYHYNRNTKDVTIERKKIRPYSDDNYDTQKTKINIYQLLKLINDVDKRYHLHFDENLMEITNGF